MLALVVPPLDRPCQVNKLHSGFLLVKMRPRHHLSATSSLASRLPPQHHPVSPLEEAASRRLDSLQLLLRRLLSVPRQQGLPKARRPFLSPALEVARLRTRARLRSEPRPLETAANNLDLVALPLGRTSNRPPRPSDRMSRVALHLAITTTLAGEAKFHASSFFKENAAMGQTVNSVTIPEMQAMDFKAARVAAPSDTSRKTPVLVHSEEVASEITIQVHLEQDLYLGQTLPRSVPPVDEGCTLHFVLTRFIMKQIITLLLSQIYFLRHRLQF